MLDLFFFFKDNVNEWVTFACDGTGPADESKRTKRVQGWSRLNWLGGILIIVSWHIHFNKLLMPLMLLCQLVARFTISFSNPTYLSVTLDLSLLFETTVDNAIAKVGARNHVLRKLTPMKQDA